jgi:predicted RecA/RadA family phage recombinase
MMRWSVFTAGCVLAASVFGQGQNVAAPGEGIFTLDPAKAIDFKGGKLYMVQGEVKADKPETLELGSLSVMQPVAVHLVTRPATAGIALTLSKPMAGERAKRVLTTAATGQVGSAFRAQGEAQLRIGGKPGATPTGVRYQMSIWVAPEAVPELAPPFRAASAESLQKGGRP